MRWRPATVALLCAAGLAVPPLAQAMPPPVAPAPVHSAQRFADPSVVVTPGGLVATSTGASTPRATAAGPAGPWTEAAPALAALPAWASGSLIWAADLAFVADRWVLYYSAPVLGLGADGRCIGVAVSPTALGEFRPVGSRPLVCPRRAETRTAYDVVPGIRQTGLPRAGVIDPSLFVDQDGSLHLLYKTQSRPSSIRVVQLNGRGLRTARRDGGDAQSVEILRSDGVVENPAVVRRGDGYVLFTSSRNFQTCRYRTEWRRSEDLTDFSVARRQTLLTRSRTGICGPGGADLARRGGATVMFLHGWVCGPAPYAACPSDFNLVADRSLNPRRLMFAARLRWTDNDRPRLRSFYAPG